MPNESHKIFMYTAIFTFVTFVLFPTGNLFSQSTHRYYPGETWIKLSQEQKKMYVVGYIDGYRGGASSMFSEMDVICSNEKKTFYVDTYNGKLEAHQKFHPEYTTNFIDKHLVQNVEQLVAGIDSCFADFTNINLPISCCMNYAQFAINGATKEHLERYIKTVQDNLSRK